MTSVKMGDRLLQVGCANGGRLGAVAAKVGLSGRAVAVVPDESSGARARKGAADAGALVEVEVAPPTRLPVDDAGFDLVVVDDTGGVAALLSPDDRATMVRELLRALRPGGRVVFIGAGRASGLGAFVSGSRPSFVSSGAATAALSDGFRSVRTLAEREGLIFVEGIKPRA
jgi:ubiquinone/menaquinone biosynthesis C-methylase UbiE